MIDHIQKKLLLEKCVTIWISEYTFFVCVNLWEQKSMQYNSFQHQMDTLLPLLIRPRTIFYTGIYLNDLPSQSRVTLALALCTVKQTQLYALYSPLGYH